MKLEPFTLIKLDVKPPESIPVMVPQGSIFQFAMLLPDRISLFYTVVEGDITANLSPRIDTYSIILSHQVVPDGATFRGVLSNVVEVPHRNEKTKKVTKEQGIMIYPIYQLKDKLIIT